MLRRAPLTTISGNKTFRKELDLLTKEVGTTLTQISRNLNVPRSTFYEVLKRLQTIPFGLSRTRSERPLSIHPREFRLLLRQLRSKLKIT